MTFLPSLVRPYSIHLVRIVSALVEEDHIWLGSGQVPSICLTESITKAFKELFLWIRFLVPGLSFSVVAF